MEFYSCRLKNNDYNNAITILNKENNITRLNQSKTFSYTWMLKIKDKRDKLLPKNPMDFALYR
jgi:hypothetical protein